VIFPRLATMDAAVTLETWFGVTPWGKVL